jgi:hypothetical protein
MAFAASYVRKLANEIWFCSPVSLALMATTADPTERLYDEKRGTELPLAADRRKHTGANTREAAISR